MEHSLHLAAKHFVQTIAPHHTKHNASMLRHGRDALPTWDSIAYWERGTKGPS